MNRGGALRVAITGAAGFIGRAIAREAVRRGHSVVAIVRPGGAAFELEGVTSLAAVDAERYAEDGTLADAFRAADVVVHAAAHIPKDFGDRAEADMCFRVNALATADVLRAAGAAKVGTVVLLSTGAVYALATSSPTEDSSAYPVHHAPYYAASKLSGELLARYFADRFPIRLSVLRLGSVYGRGMASTGVLQRFIQAAAGGNPIVVHGGEQLVDMVHVADVARAALQSGEVGFDGILNISSGERLTVLELATAVREAVNPRAPLEISPMADPVALRAPMSIERARVALRFSPRAFREGLAGMVDDSEPPGRKWGVPSS